ncbi:MAG: YcaO-like family protein [archaeon]
MEELKLNKPYKAIDPKQTVINVKNTLHKIGIYPKETHYAQDGFHSCRLEIANEEIGDIKIGTNGKGLNISYSSASAHAEFMERLQNGLLFKNLEYAHKSQLNNLSDGLYKEKIINENLVLDFVFDPEETYKTPKEVASENFEFLSKLLDIDGQNELENFIIKRLGKQKLICIPFYDHKNNATTMLPIGLIYRLCTSNGMCAGNTPKEAIIQGVSEILERYAVRQIYSYHLTPPTIPLDYFKGTKIYELILGIQDKHGYTVHIKDCSLNKDLPVLGVLVINPNNYTYNFELAADPWPVTALERCLAELHQSKGGVKILKKIDYFNDPLDPHINVLSRSIAEFINFEQILAYNNGNWPKSIFSNEYSYQFKGLNLNYGKSDAADLDYLIHLIEKLGSSLYIRDVSYLGFNSYHIVAPGLSQTGINHEGNEIYKELSNNMTSLFNVKSLQDSELRKLADTLDKLYYELKMHTQDYRKLFIQNDHPELNDLDMELFLTMAYYKLKDYKNSFKYMDKFLEKKDAKSHLYFYCIRDYLKLKSENNSDISGILTNIYQQELVNEVLDDMKNSDEIFLHHPMPSCFECEKCEVIDNCRYFAILKMAKHLQMYQKKNQPDQSRVSEILLKQSYNKPVSSNIS